MFVFVGAIELLLVPKVAWLCMKNLSSSLGLILNSNLNLGFLCFFYYKPFQATFGTENSLAMQELELEFGVFFLVLIYVLVFVGVIELFLTLRTTQLRVRNPNSSLSFSFLLLQRLLSYSRHRE